MYDGACEEACSDLRTLVPPYDVDNKNIKTRIMRMEHTHRFAQVKEYEWVVRTRRASIGHEVRFSFGIIS